MLSIAGVHMEAGVLTRDPVPHGAFKDTVVDERHSRLFEEEDDKRVVDLNDTSSFRLYRIKGIGRPPHFYANKPT